MATTIISILLTLVGIYKYPIFTLGCVLIHYHHPIIGILAIIYSLLKSTPESEDDYEYID